MALNNPSPRDVIEQFKRLYARMRDDYSELKIHHEKALAELRSHKEALASLSLPATPPEAVAVVEPTRALVPGIAIATEPKIEDEGAPSKIPVDTEAVDAEEDEDEDDGNENDSSMIWMKEVDDALRGWT